MTAYNVKVNGLSHSVDLAEGASNKAIARNLGTTPHAAKFHVASIITKLDELSALMG